MVYKNKLLKKWFYSSCLLCIFGALSYVYHQPNYNFYGIFHDKNIAIEQAIEHIPICTANDRSRHRALIHTLQVWTKFAQQHHIRYWIAYGTLVSYVQRRGLLPYDPDINLFIMAQDTSQLLQLSQLNILSTYELKVHPQWYIVDDTKRWYFSSEGIDFVAPNARFINSNDNLHLDIWPIYDYHPNHTRIEKNSRAMLTAYDKSYKWRSTPKEWTFPLQECKFSGVEVWCPAEPEKLVTDIYGEISFNMSSEKCVNGTWVKSNEFNSPKKVLEINNQTIHTKHKTNR
jgi:phosphorylcholine metabolism protein LicD